MIKNSIITLLIIISCFSQTVIAQPDSECYRGFLKLGKTAFDQGNYEEAKKDFEQGLKCPGISAENKSELRAWSAKCNRADPKPPPPPNTNLKTFEIFSKGRKYGLRKGGQIIIKPIYDSLLYIQGSKGLYVAVTKLQKERYIFYDSLALLTSSGRTIIPMAMFVRFDIGEENRTIEFQTFDFNDQSVTTIVDLNGNIIINGEDVGDRGFVKEYKGKVLNLYRIWYNDKNCCRFINMSNFNMSQCFYYSEENAYEGKIKIGVRRDLTTNSIDGYGFINEKAELIIEPDFDSTWLFHEGMCGVKKKNKWGYMDSNGKEVIPCQYNYVNDFSEGMAWVKKDQFYGVIDKNGKTILPFEYRVNDEYDFPIFENGFTCGIYLKSDLKFETKFCVSKDGKLKKE